MGRISTLMHGVIDYTTAVGVLMLSGKIGASPALRGVLALTAATTFLYSLMTRYELGFAKVLPMRTHLTLDGIFGALTCALPFLFSNEPMRARGAVLGLGIFEMIVTLSTRGEPENVDMLPGVSGEVVDRLSAAVTSAEERVGQVATR